MEERARVTKQMGRLLVYTREVWYMALEDKNGDDIVVNMDGGVGGMGG